MLGLLRAAFCRRIVMGRVDSWACERRRGLVAHSPVAYERDVCLVAQHLGFGDLDRAEPGSRPNPIATWASSHGQQFGPASERDGRPDRSRALRAGSSVFPWSIPYFHHSMCLARPNISD